MHTSNLNNEKGPPHTLLGIVLIIVCVSITILLAISTTAIHDSEPIVEEGLQSALDRSYTVYANLSQTEKYDLFVEFKKSYSKMVSLVIAVST